MPHQATSTIYEGFSGQEVVAGQVGSGFQQLKTIDEEIYTTGWKTKIITIIPIERAIMSYNVREKGRKRREKQTGKKNAAREVFLVDHEDSKDFQPNEKFLRILLMAAQPKPRSVAGRTLTRFPPSELTWRREHTFQIENQDWFNMTFVFGRLAHLIALDNPEPHDHLARSGTPWNTWWAHSPGHGS